MKVLASGTILGTSVKIQVFVTVVIWGLMVLYLYIAPQSLDPKISFVSLIGVPAAVIGVSQLLITAHVQRASYIKDYAIRFRTDKELSESFHYLVYRFGNELYDTFSVLPEDRKPEQAQKLEAAQLGVASDLCFFNPKNALGLSQERRLDNLLGFFDTLAYDYSRQLVAMRDIAGVFGFHLDHFIQRKVVEDYLKTIELGWPSLASFHERYSSPVPFDYFRKMIRDYVDFRNQDNQKRSN